MVVDVIRIGKTACCSQVLTILTLMQTAGSIAWCVLAYRVQVPGPEGMGRGARVDCISRVWSMGRHGGGIRAVAFDCEVNGQAVVGMER